ncbi:MAG: peptide chain release factor N(5)-glutamine methyltransferase [Desulfobulbaceae bacterium]|nr:MAG: peptide chain release factor N(5)-glutamine methyltransferase [Desulfobulbaceae bacterium]
MQSNRDVRRIADLLHHGIFLFDSVGIDAPQTEAELVVTHCLELSRTDLYLRAQEQISRVQADRCLAMMQRRSENEPLAYITGEREFWSYTFNVSPAVLIPRPETEILIERVLAARDCSNAGGGYLDLCCGSGVIAIVLALELDVEVIGVDISRPALKVCRSNCARHGVEQRVHLVQGDLASCFAENEQFSLITCNPPYVSSSEMAAGMQPEVAKYEPILALDGGPGGLNHISRVIATFSSLLAPGGYFFMEIGAGQGGAVKELLARSDSDDLYTSIDIIKDYSGRDRVVEVRKNDQY